ncbi:MAG: bifunctional phosphoribosyl-AMP cyclohydrolase/phosphoribosyl-ATP diphosphatase HisIE [Pseudomonadota bacterium]
MIDALDFEKCPLIPAVVQDAASLRVLMLGYMNRDAVEKTLDSGLVTFFSRSRQCLWTKGETSGNTLTLVDLRADCDNDTLLVTATPAGPTCHLGTTTCFDGAQDDAGPGRSFLWQLESTIDQRLAGDTEDSYVASLVRKGVSKVAQKVGEEGVEVALAAVGGDRDELISESADLLFHLQVLLRSQGLGLDDVAAELASRAR